MDNVIFVGNILKAAIGLGFVIFIHELGHFLLAKWNGVKVEKFSIGFGPTLASFRRGVGLRVGTGSRPPGPGDPPTWGETEYILAALPLGGYVKMLGESPEEVTPDSEATINPRAYNNKSVWGRMQIITAGVIMNLILGWACFSFAYTQGATDAAAKVGGVLAAAPAYRAGLLPGDEIVAIDGHRDVGFRDLTDRVNMSGAGQKIKFTIRRAGSEAEQTVEIEPLRDPSYPVPTIGILSSHALELRPKTAFRVQPGQNLDKAETNPGFEGGDKVVAVGPVGGPSGPIKDQVDLIEKLEKLRSVPVEFEVERKKADGPAQLVKVVVPPHCFLDFGLRLTPGPITAIRPDSPASKAGLKEGDRIEQFDGDADFDPMRLPDLARDRAGKPVTVVVTREVEGKPTRVELSVTPDASPAWADPFDPYLRLVPLDVPGLGLALSIEPKIKAVAEGSPADKAGFKAGETLHTMILTPARGEDEKSRPRPITIKLDDKVSGWPTAFGAIQELPTESIELTTDKSDKPIKIIPEVDPARFLLTRGLIFEPLIRKIPPLGLAESMSRGWDETVNTVLNTFRMFKGMFQGRISHDAVGGVIPIAGIAYSMASQGWPIFVHFLGLLSISLAVLNFLPIPPLDGGQFTLLAIEKVRGKPLPESAQNSVMLAGLVFVLGLIVLVNGRDIFKLVSSYF